MLSRALLARYPAVHAALLRRPGAYNGALDSVEEMDRLFICNMGEWWGDYAYTLAADGSSASDRPGTAAPGLYIELKRGDGFTGWNTSVPRLRGFDTVTVITLTVLLNSGVSQPGLICTTGATTTSPEADRRVRSSQ